MTRELTHKEAAAIRSAFDQLEYLAETTDCSAPLRLREALKHETRQRSSRVVAQALMVAEALAGLLGTKAFDGAARAATPAELWGLSSGLAAAHMFGADVGRRYGTSYSHADQVGAGRFRDRVRDFVAVAGEAAAAHRAVQERRKSAARGGGQ
jgi:hypothetical protein